MVHQVPGIRHDTIGRNEFLTNVDREMEHHRLGLLISMDCRYNLFAAGNGFSGIIHEVFRHI